jgi:arsenate reductase
VKKAFAWLEGNGVQYRFHDYKKDGAPGEKVRAWVKALGWEALVNTKGPTFRKLPAVRQQELTAAKAVALMVEFPSLIRRPVIESGKELLVGFDPGLYQRSLLS